MVCGINSVEKVFGLLLHDCDDTVITVNQMTSTVRVFLGTLGGYDNTS